MDWQPTASLNMLRSRAQLNADIRHFFADLGVMEVETPLLGSTSVTDPNIESYRVAAGEVSGYLQTSPEYCMKRLLAAGSGDIYALCKSFRVDEAGRYHNREFTILEWYRLGYDDRRLAQELVALIERLQPKVHAEFNTYAELFEQSLGVNPHTATSADLQRLAQHKLGVDWNDEPKSLWLDLLFTHCVEPRFADRLQIIWDYPECQSALARVMPNSSGQQVARRFEVYWQGVELANGYWELTDATEQRRRFQQDNRLRAQLKRAPVAPDESLLAALASGLPDCAGVALGVDRLLMCLTNADSIEQVLSFR